jgi:rhamnulokinase
MSIMAGIRGRNLFRKENGMTEQQPAHLAFDLGATSWRAILGRPVHGGISMKELHRERHHPRECAGGLFWDIEGIFQGMKRVMREAASLGIAPSSIGIDSWSVDYGLLDKKDRLLEQPRCYRDRRNLGMSEKVAGMVGQRELFVRTGLIQEDITTLCQLVAAREACPELLQAASTLLFIPDLLRHRLCGKMATDFTLASTSQMYNLQKRGWDGELLQRLGIPRGILPPVREGDSILGTLSPDVQEETGLRGDIGIAIGTSHDTAAAFSTQRTGKDEAILSSGTWSMLGIHMEKPLFLESIDPKRFGYEGNPDGSVRLLCNIPGMWILEQCLECWRKELGELSWETLIAGAECADAFTIRVDPYDPAFAVPGDMPEEIRKYCVRTGQLEPRTPFETACAVFAGLADAYALAVEELGGISGRRIKRVHVIGGGSRNLLLNRLFQQRAGIEVVRGPAEATALGNIRGQIRALSACGSAET